MAPDVVGIERLDDRPIAISPAAIEEEFTRMWGESATAGLDDASVRLRTMNFVGIGPETWTVERFERVMESLPQRHPCRGVLAVTSPDRHGLEASISARCWRTNTGGRHVCSEEVVLKAGVEDQLALASTVLALLVPELPLTVWVVGPIDLETQLASEIIESADTVFVDTADAIDVTATLRAAITARRKHDVAICDLAWRRLSVWRSLVAQLFDGDIGAQRLAQLRGIEIIGGAGISSEVLLIAGWFISRLGLSLAEVTREPDTIVATLYDGSRGVSLRLTNSAQASGRVTEIKVQSGQSDFTVQAHAESGHMHIRQDGSDGVDRRTAAQPPTDDASVFAEALDDSSDLPIFLDAARGALTLLDG
jgi:glucose-6-phosphate dehydrogenase assembly protein OpcA